MMRSAPRAEAESELMWDWELVTALADKESAYKSGWASVSPLRLELQLA